MFRLNIGTDGFIALEERSVKFPRIGWTTSTITIHLIQQQLHLLLKKWFSDTGMECLFAARPATALRNAEISSVPSKPHLDQQIGFVDGLSNVEMFLSLFTSRWVDHQGGAGKLSTGEKRYKYDVYLFFSLYFYFIYFLFGRNVIDRIFHGVNLPRRRPAHVIQAPLTEEEQRTSESADPWNIHQEQ